MSSRRHVTLLLVEDDELVRLTVAMTLEDLGFAVLEATTGEAALQVTGAKPRARSCSRTKVRVGR